MGPVGPPLPPPPPLITPSLARVERISIQYYTKSWRTISRPVSFLPRPFFVSPSSSNPNPLSAPLRSQRGIIRRKGVADPKKGRRWFSSSCVPFVSGPHAGYPISSFRVAGINRCEMERNEPIPRIHGWDPLRNPSLETLEHPPESSIRGYPRGYLGLA